MENSVASSSSPPFQCLSNNFSLGFVEGVEPLQERRMRVVPRRVEPVVDGEAEIVQIQLDQRRLELDGVAEPLGEAVGLELKVAAEQRRQERQHRVVRREDVRRDQIEADEDGLRVVKAERCVKRLVLEQQVEDEEYEQDVHLGDDDVLGDVVQLPMAQFVAQNGQNLLVVAALLGRRRRRFASFFFFFFDVALDQRIEQYDALVLEEAVEISVAVR